MADVGGEVGVVLKVLAQVQPPEALVPRRVHPVEDHSVVDWREDEWKGR